MDLKPYFAGALAFVILVFGLAVGAAALSLQYDAEQATFTENDTLTVNYTQPSSLDPAEDVAQYHGDETVTNVTGAVLANSTDYRYNASNGTVKWFNTTATASGESATIEYRYDGWRRTAADIHAIVVTLFRLLPYLALVVVGVMVVGGLMYALTRSGTTSSFGRSSKRRY